ncbi:MAG: hypothetical protein WAN11_25270, partial [Syntrophobacteraceae bacterium]
PPFGAALGNPEMARRQTVRARTKNAFLLGQKSESETAHVSPSVSDEHYLKSGYKIKNSASPAVQFTDSVRH